MTQSSPAPTFFFFFSSRRRHTRLVSDWSSDVCSSDLETLYCSAKDAFIPGPNAGIYATTIEHQVRQSIRNLLDNLEEADMDLGDVVAANVYLADISDFQAMNRIYAKYFKAPYPARTTIQQIAPVERKADDEGEYPALEQISLIAVRRQGEGVAGRAKRGRDASAGH